MRSRVAPSVSDVGLAAGSIARSMPGSWRKVSGPMPQVLALLDVPIGALAVGGGWRRGPAEGNLLRPLPTQRRTRRRTTRFAMMYPSRRATRTTGPGPERRPRGAPTSLACHVSSGARVSSRSVTTSGQVPLGQTAILIVRCQHTGEPGVRFLQDDAIAVSVPFST
jgi:hypothetical protein